MRGKLDCFGFDLGFGLKFLKEVFWNNVALNTSSILNATSAPFISSITDQSDSVSLTVNTLASLDADPA